MVIQVNANFVIFNTDSQTTNALNAKQDVSSVMELLKHAVLAIISMD
jgi:hypothetical protein